MKNSIIDVRPLSPTVGAELHGVDLAKPLEERAVFEIRDALHKYGVVFFRDQTIDKAQHLAFTERFGPIKGKSFLGTVEGYPMIGEVRKEPDQSRNIGGDWHTDHAFIANPPLGSVLVARELPAVGGDTMFTNMGNAYDRLSDGLKKTLSTLRAVQAKRQSFKPDAPADRRVDGAEKDKIDQQFAQYEFTHPVVIAHPESGRTILYVNPTYTVRFEGWTQQESAPLLQYLYQHAVRPEFVCRFNWREGSIAFWDNRSVMHYALNDYHGERRLMHRITVEGSPLAAATV